MYTKLLMRIMKLDESTNHVNITEENMMVMSLGLLEQYVTRSEKTDHFQNFVMGITVE